MTSQIDFKRRRIQLRLDTNVAKWYDAFGMAADRTLRWFLLALATGAGLIGCGRKTDTDFPTWAQVGPAYSPQPSSPNAFDTYVIAAQTAERQGGPNLTRVNFFPGHKKDAEKDIAESINQVSSAANGKLCQFQFVPVKPFYKRPNDAGWRLIGRVFGWEIEDAIKAGNFDQAIQLAITGSKFGFDLTGGDAMEASLGLSIVDSIRLALVPCISNLTAAQLDTLASGMKAALARKPPISVTIANEKQGMLLAVQTVQDDFKSNSLADLQTELGPNAKDGIDYLASLEGEKPQKRIDYFNSLSGEANAISTWAADAADQPTRDRQPLKLGKDRPWWRISRHFFGSLEPLLAIEDQTLARTRLLVLNCALKAMAKKNVPPSLNGFASPLDTDPYSGNPFILHSDGLDFNIYSVGENLKDDGGDTDASFTKPDLLLEQSS